MGKAALGSWLFAFGQKLPCSIVIAHALFRFLSISGAKSEEPKAKSRTQVPCFQDFACKSHGLKIFKESFLPAQWNQDFTGYRGGGGYANPYSLFAVRSGLWPRANAERRKANLAGGRCLADWELAAGSWCLAAELNPAQIKRRLECGARQGVAATPLQDALRCQRRLDPLVQQGIAVANTAEADAGFRRHHQTLNFQAVTLAAPPMVFPKKLHSQKPKPSRSRNG